MSKLNHAYASFRLSTELNALNLQQLEMLKNQLDQETEMFSVSLQSLKAAQQKFVESQQNLETLTPSNEGKEILVPLTSSMYVPGHLSDVKGVMVDIGTGYYVEKSTEEAKVYFKRKIDFCTQQMEKVQPLLQDRASKKQAVLDVMRDKVIQMQMMQMQAGQPSRA